MKQNTNILKRIGYSNIVIVLMQLCMYPYMFFWFWGLPGINEVSVVFFVIISLLCIVKIKGGNRIPAIIAFIMTIQSIVWLLYYVYYNDTSYLVRIFFIILSYLSLYLLSKDNSIEKFPEIYNYTIAIQGGLGIIAFFLLFFNILTPIASAAFNDYGDLYEFYGLTFVKVHIGNFARINGFFDEPGAFAFWGMFALLFNKLLFDNRKLEVTIIVSLLFTFSAAYFVLLPIYFILFYRLKIKFLLILMVLSLPLIFFVSNFLSENEAFLRYTTERFEGGEIRSTRYDQAEDTKKIFDSSPILGIGAQNLEDKYGTHSSDNPYEILAKDGVVGLLITYLPLFYLFSRYWKNRMVFGSILILSLNYLQRPFHINEMHYFMLYLFCLVVILKYGKVSRRVTVSKPLVISESNN